MKIPKYLDVLRRAGTEYGILSGKIRWIIAAAGCIMAVCLAVLVFRRPESPGLPPEAEPSGTEPQAVEDVRPSEPETLPAAEDPAPLPPEPEAYEFGTPLEESEPVDGEWFDHAAFLGDSRTEGLQLFSGLMHGDYFWNRGLSIFRADDSDYSVFDVDGEKVTMVGTLRGKSYDAVYIMLGINDLGHLAEDYEAALSKLIDGIEEAQPEAVIYLQTLPPVNDAAVEKNDLSSDIRNETVSAFNDAIVHAAAEKQVVLLDTASLYRGEDGQLPAEMTVDGVHFVLEGYAMWADYLRCHVMDPQRYFYARER